LLFGENLVKQLDKAEKRVSVLIGGEKQDFNVDEE